MLWRFRRMKTRSTKSDAKVLLNFLPASGIVMAGGVWPWRRLLLLKGVEYYGNLPSHVFQCPCSG